MRQTGNYAILRPIGVIVVLSVLADQALAYVLETPDYILPCSKSDPQINACIQKTFNHMRPYLSKGIQELNVPPLEPLSIPRLAMENGHGPVRVRAAFSNVTAYGASNYTVGDVRTDLDSWKIDLILSVPRIEANGRYEVTGNVLLFPVRSFGDFWAAFGDINALAKLQGREVEQDGMTFLQIEHIGVDFTLSKSRFKIRDSVNSKNLLGEAMNRFLNENANAIVDEMKPAASSSIGKHFAGFLNKAFSNIPVNVWLKD